MNLNAALVIDVHVLALRCRKELLVVQEVHIPCRLLYLRDHTRRADGFMLLRCAAQAGLKPPSPFLLT